MEIIADYASEWELTLDSVVPSTRRVYLRGVRQFAEWMAANHPARTELTDITRAHVRAWLASMATTHADGTRRVRLIAVRLFFGYLVGEPDVELSSNPTTGIELPKVIVQPVPMPREQDVSELLASVNGPRYLDRRDQLIVRMLLDVGCRRSELSGVDVVDLDVRDPRAATVTLRRTKNGRARVAPLANKTVLSLKKYLRARAKHRATEQPALLLSERGNKAGDHRLTGAGIAEMLERRCGRSGIDRIKPHGLRHLWAHDQLASGMNESAVEILAGWSSPMMVRRYGSSLAAERAIDASRKLARGDRV